MEAASFFFRFGKCFGKVESHPKLGHLQPNVSQEGIENLEKLKTDRYFYEELCGARIAAYQYGLDGAQWIQDNFGINLGEDYPYPIVDLATRKKIALEVFENHVKIIK